jgi:putative oxidoreductase
MELNHCKRWAEGHADIFVDLVRIYLGIGLAVKGIFFMTHRDYLLNLLEQSGNLVIAPVTIAHYVIPAHIFGGVLLALGLLTRLAALLQLPILIGAVFWVYLPKAMTLEPRQYIEFSALVLFLMVLILIFGPGRWSVDHYLSRREPGELHPQPAT